MTKRTPTGTRGTGWRLLSLSLGLCGSATLAAFTSVNAIREVVADENGPQLIAEDDAQPKLRALLDDLLPPARESASGELPFGVVPDLEPPLPDDDAPAPSPGRLGDSQKNGESSPQSGEKKNDSTAKVAPESRGLWTESTLPLRDRLRTTVAAYRAAPLNTRDHNHWEIMHRIVAFGVQTEIETGGPGGPLVNAITWQCWNQPCRGETMLYRSNGQLQARRGPRVQGHEGQFLKMLALSGVSRDYPMQVDGQQFQVRDLIESEKAGCRTGIELTFKLIGLSYYVEDMDETWKNSLGEDWTLARMIREELEKPILRGAACGGTHRLMGLTQAVRHRKRRDMPVTGEYARAEAFIQDYIKLTFGLQNEDGSFSTEYFRGKAANPNLDRRLETTGHILEWMAYALPEEQLTDPRMLRAVDYLTRLLADSQRRWEIGPLGHGTHGLIVFDRRMSRIMK